ARGRALSAHAGDGDGPGEADGKRAGMHAGDGRGHAINTRLVAVEAELGFVNQTWAQNLLQGVDHILRNTGHDLVRSGDVERQLQVALVAAVTQILAELVVDVMIDVEAAE